MTVRNCALAVKSLAALRLCAFALKPQRIVMASGAKTSLALSTRIGHKVNMKLRTVFLANIIYSAAIALADDQQLATLQVGSEASPNGTITSVPAAALYCSPSRAL